MKIFNITGNFARIWHWFFAYGADSSKKQLAIYGVFGTILVYHATCLINAICGIHMVDGLVWGEGCIWNPHDEPHGFLLLLVDWGFIICGAVCAAHQSWIAICKRTGHFRYLRLCVCRFPAVEKDEAHGQVVCAEQPFTRFLKLCNLIQIFISGKRVHQSPVAWCKYHRGDGTTRWRLTLVFNSAVFKTIFYLYILATIAVALVLTEGFAWPGDWEVYRSIFGDDAQTIFKYFITRPARYILPLMWSIVPGLMLIIVASNVFCIWACRREGNEHTLSYRSCLIYTIAMWYRRLLFHSFILTNLIRIIILIYVNE